MHKKIEKYLITPNMMVSDAIESIVLNHERLVFVADKNLNIVKKNMIIASIIKITDLIN